MSVVLKLVLVQLVLWGSFHPLLGIGTTAGQDTVSPTEIEQLYGRIVKDIRISELRYTKPEIIIRELASRVGEPYLKENAEKDAERLDQLGICSSIKIEPIGDGEEVVLEIEIEETFPYLPAVSLEISDENGLSIGPGFKSINLGGRVISLSASTGLAVPPVLGPPLRTPGLLGITFPTGWSSISETGIMSWITLLKFPAKSIFVWAVMWENMAGLAATLTFSR